MWISLPYPLKSPMEAQFPADYEPQLEEAAFLRFASNPGLSLLRWFSTSFCPSTSYQTSAGTVGNRQEGRGREIGFILGSCRSREAPRLHLPCHGARCRIARMQKLPSSPYLRTDAVGTGITPRPPPRSVRAELPHTAPALGTDDHPPPK